MTKRVSRREALISSAKLSLLGAFCATVGSTIIAACTDDGERPPGFQGCSGGYDAYGNPCGGGYGYDDLPGDGYGSGYGGGYGSGY